MANTFTCLEYHIVFSTKHRERWLRPEAQDRVWAYLGGIARENRLTALLVGGVEDHVQEEYLDLLHRHGIKYDERYLWD